MTDRQITKDEFLRNGGNHNPTQYTTGSPVHGNQKFWTKASR